MIAPMNHTTSLCLCLVGVPVASLCACSSVGAMASEPPPSGGGASRPLHVSGTDMSSCINTESGSAERVGSFDPSFDTTLGGASQLPQPTTAGGEGMPPSLGSSLQPQGELQSSLLYRSDLGSNIFASRAGGAASAACRPNPYVRFFTSAIVGVRIIEPQ